MEGLTNAFSYQNLLWLVVGVTLGLIAGTLPGFTGGSMMAVVLPLIVGLPVDTMLITLAAIYAANVYSDSTAGILYNIPGGAAGIPATVEGYQLKLKGRLVEAFAAQVSGSFAGAIIGFIVLMLLVPTFLYFVQFFGSAERALLAVWALVFISSGVITRDDPLRSFVSVGIGLMLGLVGQQPNIGTFRFTFGLTGLWDGMKVVLVVLGLFAIPQLLQMISARNEFRSENQDVTRVPFGKLYRSMAKILWDGRGIVLRSSLFGVFIGIIPGIGTSAAAWGGYSVARNHSKRPERFGEGNRDGVLGAEAASNAGEVGTIIPLLALGIPGSAGAAIMLASLTLVGINPGPSMYSTYGAEVWTIMFGTGLSAIAFTALAYPFIVGAQSLSRLSVPFLVGGIGTLCVMGAYLQAHNLFGAVVMMVIGILTLLGSQIGLKPAAVLIGFVLGPNIEKELIRAYQIGGFERFLKPTAAIILLIVVVTLIVGVLQNYRERQRHREGRGTEEPAQKESQDTVIKDVVFATIAILLALGLLAASLNYPLFASLWVYFVAGPFLLLPAGLLLASRLPSLSSAVGSVRARQSDWRLDKRELGGALYTLAAFFVFIALVRPLGFIPSTAVFVLGLVLFFDRSILRAILAALIVAALAFAITRGFGIYMPRGIVNLPL